MVCHTNTKIAFVARTVSMTAAPCWPEGGVGCMGVLVVSCPHAPSLSAAISSASCAAAAAASFTAAGFHCVQFSPPSALVQPCVWQGLEVTEWDFDRAIMRDPAIIHC